MDDALIWSFIGVGFLLMCSAFFSGSETALMATSKAKLHELDRQGITGVRRVLALLENTDVLLGTILLGNNLVNIGASALTTGIFIGLFGEAGMLYATLLMTFFVLLFSEVLPKSVAARHPDTFSRVVAFPMYILVYVLRPLTWVIRMLSTGLMRLIGINPDQNAAFDEHDVRGAIGLGKQHGVLEKNDHRMLEAILDLESLTVEEVMTHRSRMLTLDLDMPLDELDQAIAQSPYSRIPVWQGNPDHIVGTLHIKDYYAALRKSMNDETPLILKDILAPPYFAPETANIAQQLFEFRRLRRHQALVVDEYGDLQGLVTLEDVIEEIVGDIEDEHDKRTVGIQDRPGGGWHMPGNTKVRDINRALDLTLPEDEDAVTIGGLLIDTLGHLPSVGETVQLDGVVLKVLSIHKQAVTKVEIQQVAPATTTED